MIPNWNFSLLNFWATPVYSHNVLITQRNTHKSFFLKKCDDCINGESKQMIINYTLHIHVFIG